MPAIHSNESSQWQPTYQVWLDVGGTFTDCLVQTPAGKRLIGKVLSSGITKGTVRSGSTQETIVADLGADLPDHFWRGFTLNCFFQETQTLATTKIVGYDAATQSLQLETALPHPPTVGDSFELTCELHAPVLALRKLLGLPLDHRLPKLDVRMGTTRGTNALLTRSGASTALVTNLGFGDCLEIGEQDRPDLFALNIHKRRPLANVTVEVDQRTAADGTVLRTFPREATREKLRKLKAQGVESLAICLLHAWNNPEQEQALAELAREVGFTEISCSHEIAPVIRFVPRAETTVLDAYLNPILANYLTGIHEQFGGPSRCQLRLMTSGGVLVNSHAMRGKDSVLSGPAGGVVALAAILAAHGIREAIGLDMGGTSTDVSRIAGQPVKQFEAIQAGVRVLTPSMAIHTVAAGGGSICRFDGEQLRVGPESAGAAPGPACYGRGGPLAVTDLNLALGRLVAKEFPFPLDAQTVRQRLDETLAQVIASGSVIPSREHLAEGFWRIANHAMAEAVRSISITAGVDPRPLVLVGFGGAAGQHLCAIADILGMHQVLDHPESGVLSALGMGLAEIGRGAVKGLYQPLSQLSADRLLEISSQLAEENLQQLRTEAIDLTSVRHASTIELRYQGTDTAIELPLAEAGLQQLTEHFSQSFEQRFGYLRPEGVIEAVSLRVTSTAQGATTAEPLTRAAAHTAVPSSKQRLFCQDTWHDAGLFQRTDLPPGSTLDGPALIVGPWNTLVVDPGWQAQVCSDGSVFLRREPSQAGTPHLTASDQTSDPVLLEILSRRFQAIADQMGATLQRTAISVNIKERRDFSCAIFRQDGSLVANAPHVPVHLGAMGHTVRHLLEKFPDLGPGDCLVTNDPYSGGSHLPDVTVVSGVFLDQETRPRFLVANRAHHAEIGGMTPGSMPPHATRLEEEGVLIRDFALVHRGHAYHHDLLNLLTASPFPSRCPQENMADIAAQQAANQQGINDLKNLCAQYTPQVVEAYMGFLQDLAARAIAHRLQRLPEKTLSFVDHLDDGSRIQVQITRTGPTICIDFSGTSGTHPLNFNATRGIVTAAVMYSLRTLIEEPLPLNEGVLRSIDLRIPAGLLDPPVKADCESRPAVVAGNVETSQRIVDVLLGAFGVCAASQGTMNNFLMGNDRFGYYETICGGSGATPTAEGASAVHTHMTNTRITDPEILETRLPVRLLQFAVRRGSGGNGRYRGGDGVIRELEFLAPLSISLITSRRGPYAPYGIDGGEPGMLGKNWRIFPDGREALLPGCVHYQAARGERIRLETPGGGGAGAALPIHELHPNPQEPNQQQA